MKWLERLGEAWDRYIGSVQNIAAGLVAVAGIIGITYNIFMPNEVDCLRADLTYASLEYCVFVHSNPEASEYLQNLWSDKRLVGDGAISTLLPTSRRELHSEWENDQFIVVLISAWGPWRNSVRGLVKCERQFSNLEDAENYWQFINRLEKGEWIQFTGIVDNVGKSNLAVSDCTVFIPMD